MFGKKKRASEEAPPGKRYRVETVNLNATFKPEGRAGQIEDALNRGDAKGWKLVSMEDHGQWHVRVIVWDTERDPVRCPDPETRTDQRG